LLSNSSANRDVSLTSKKVKNNVNHNRYESKNGRAEEEQCFLYSPYPDVVAEAQRQIIQKTRNILRWKTLPKDW
jgi:hypothetical protein